ncbi:MAG: bifunctional UDP-N-acetylglucosamine diphosphorylase/glucosamine-1-phosphate N-acetyltransferase GlmU [Arenicellales bacterium]
MALDIVILAAGKGSRMKSDLPKVLHTLAGKSMLAHVLDAADQLKPDNIHVVIGHRADAVKATIDSQQYTAKLHWAIQSEQLGTGHAVMQALPNINPDAMVLIMAGDVPLIEAETLIPLCAETHGVHVLTAIIDDASGFGRIVRDANNQITEIVEHKDADESQLAIQEFNTGILSAQAKNLSDWLSRVENKNAQKEYYLPDIIALSMKDEKGVTASITHDTVQVMGINSRLELSRLERQYQIRLAEQFLDSGADIADPARFDVRGNLRLGKDCKIDINALFEGEVSLGDGVTIGPNVLIRNSQIGDHCTIEANSIIDHATVENQCIIGPFARLRPETHLLDNSKIGNFVEIKKSVIGIGSKVNHLSYIGDSTVGRNVNIGAGVITCNYDGANKHQTIIGDDVFVGSDCQLVAPVEIGQGATIGAGSTITRDAPADMLSLSRSKQMKLSGWERPTKSPSNNKS